MYIVILINMTNLYVLVPFVYLYMTLYAKDFQTTTEIKIAILLWIAYIVYVANYSHFLPSRFLCIHL